MANSFAITKAIRDSKYQIAAIVVTDNPEGRKFTGGLGRTFIPAEIDECTEEVFLSRLPHQTDEAVLALPSGSYTFDPNKKLWS